MLAANVVLVTSLDFLRAITDYQDGIPAPFLECKPWQCIRGIEGRYQSQHGGALTHSADYIDSTSKRMEARCAVLRPYIDDRHGRDVLHRIVASRLHVRNCVLECVAYLGLVDLFQSLEAHVARCRTFAYPTVHVQRQVLFRRMEPLLDSSTDNVYATVPSLLQLAALQGHVPMLQHLYASAYPREFGLATSYDYFSDMEVAARRNKMACVYFLAIQSGSVFSAYGRFLMCGKYVNHAAACGHVDLVRFLVDRRVKYTANALDGAAANGHLDVVVYLHEKASRCTTYAMDGAAANGHLDIVQFLHAHRTEGCTTDAMDDAATNGHDNIVHFLLQHRSDGCTRKGMDAFVATGNLDMVQRLHAHGAKECSTKVLGQAAAAGFVDMVHFVVEHDLAKWTVVVVKGAVQSGHLDLVKYLVDQKPNICLAQPLALAHEANDKAIAIYLEGHACSRCKLKSIGGNMKPTKKRRRYFW
ncbi:Aste57867_25387 [Aphanomyces stellatus]|uniref:Aste57867_25387 protein n=1 Tax=Aphanomyces stellatus TaxID=120398 RepID=A0A485LTN2_9STRA|nr:hypothetical protein As57867_025308 [Aphanomyces stellatus]VFU02012.1 Aste57867_25387 [Aphanomyces stellatus]